MKDALDILQKHAVPLSNRVIQVNHSRLSSHHKKLVGYKGEAIAEMEGAISSAVEQLGISETTGYPLVKLENVLNSK
jgi:hypothetical protein